MRYNVTLPEYLVKLTDERAKKLGISRSAYIATALQYKMQADDIAVSLPEFAVLFKSLDAKLDKLNEVR